MYVYFVYADATYQCTLLVKGILSQGKSGKENNFRCINYISSMLCSFNQIYALLFNLPYVTSVLR